MKRNLKKGHRMNGVPVSEATATKISVPVLAPTPDAPAQTVAATDGANLIRITDSEADSMRNLDGALVKLKIALADVVTREEDLRRQSESLTKQREAVANEIGIMNDQMLKTARAIATAHGIDLDGPDRWNLDTNKMTFQKIS